MDPIYIQYLLKKKGSNQRRIAEERGCNEGHVSRVLFGLRRSRPVQRAIARAIDLPVTEVFPPKAALKEAA